MMKQILTCLVVFVMISCSAFAQDVVTDGNRVYAGFSIYTYDNTLVEARDQDPVSSFNNPDVDAIVISKSHIGAKNNYRGAHRRIANTAVYCHSDSS